MKYVRFMLSLLVAYVGTFLLASLLNIAAGQPFSATQILWINFAVTAVMGTTLGMDKEAPGLMRRTPRPRDAQIMTGSMLITVGLAGLYMAVWLDSLIVIGKDHYGSVMIGSTIALASFTLMLIVTAYQSRSQTDTTFQMSTFDNCTLNLVVLAEIFLAILMTRGGALSSLLGTSGLSGNQWLWALGPAALMFILWEAAKLLVRRRTGWARRTGVTIDPI